MATPYEVTVGNVPVIIDDAHVGDAVVSSDGWLNITFLDGNSHPRKIAEMLMHGQLDAITIVPQVALQNIRD